jgi:hypothetical protein
MSVELTNVLNQFSTADLYVIAGIAASGLLGLLKAVYANIKNKELHEAVATGLSFAIPFSGALVDGVFNSGSQFLVKGTAIYVLSQLAYYTVKALLALLTKNQPQATLQGESQF